MFTIASKNVSLNADPSHCRKIMLRRRDEKAKGEYLSEKICGFEKKIVARTSSLLRPYPSLSILSIRSSNSATSQPCLGPHMF